MTGARPRDDADAIGTGVGTTRDPCDLDFFLLLRAFEDTATGRVENARGIGISGTLIRSVARR